MSWENLFLPYANNKGADHLRICAFVARCLDSIIPLVSISEIASLYLVSVTAQTGLSLPGRKPRRQVFSWRGSIKIKLKTKAIFTTRWNGISNSAEDIKREIEQTTRTAPIEPRHEKSCLRGLRPGRQKPACAATESSKRLAISDIETRGILLSGQRKTKALIRLRGCAG